LAIDLLVATPVLGLPIERLAAMEVDVLLVDARRDDDRTEALDNLASAARIGRVVLVVAGHEDRAGRERSRFSDRDARSDPEGARLVARGRDDAAPALVPSDDDGLVAKARIEQPLDRHEERVEVEAADPRAPHTGAWYW
jgi:hypothetical protein